MIDDIRDISTEPTDVDVKMGAALGPPKNQSDRGIGLDVSAVPWPATNRTAEAPLGAHSVKPSIFAKPFGRWFPDLPKIELFCRGPPGDGWAAWGNEAATIAHPTALSGLAQRDKEMTVSDAKPYEFYFVARDELSPDFRRRAAGHRTKNGGCCICGGPIQMINQLGLIMVRHRAYADVVGALVCCACAQLPRDKLIKKFPDAESSAVAH